MKEKIAKIIKDHIRPFLISHGGDIELVEITKDKVVKVRLTGACQNCPVAEQTLTNLVENMIKSQVPQIKKVEEVK